jgi:protein O-GlcNAc transferase
MLIADAVSLWRSGKVQAAESMCSALLSSQRTQVDARNLLAEIYSTTGRFGLAVEQLQRLADIKPDAAVLRRLGDAQFSLGDMGAAAVTFRRAIELDPRHPRAHNNLGRVLARTQETEAAIASLRHALALDPRYAIAQNNLGICLGQSGDLAGACDCYEQAIALNPRFAEAHSNRGNVLLLLNRPQEALASHERALALEPFEASMHCNCGNSLLQTQDNGRALGFYERALQLRSDFPEALVGRGNALRELRRFDEAIADYDRALLVQPDYLQALSNRANILLELERFEEAIACCDRILRLKPDFPQALLYRGLSLNFLGQLRYEEASNCFYRLWQANPLDNFALGYLLHASMMIGDWRHAELVAEAVRGVADGKAVVSPFAFLALTDSAAAQLKCAQVCTARVHPSAKHPIYKQSRPRKPKIRLAYVSGDLRDHALSYLMVGVFEQHDRDQFEVFGVSLRPPDGNPFGTRVVKSTDVFLDLCDKTDQQAAQLLHDMEIDIAVDLMGFTRGQRLNIFSHRPAPVQVNYLGYPATTGAPYMDYLLADRFVVPNDRFHHYSESVVWLPDCFQANDDRRLIGDRVFTRAEVGLPETALVFCCFNSTYKINREIFDVWCRLLKTCPNSVLWMVAESEVAQANLSREARIRGIDPGLLIFAPRLLYAEHLARLQLADLFLDTVPFNAGTTASDALWAGLPVVTCAGEAFAARMAGSLLHAIDLPELVTDTLEAYEKLARRLATEPGALAAVRARLAVNRTTQPLFETRRFCRNLESAFVTMHERSQRGEPPAHFSVSST